MKFQNRQNKAVVTEIRSVIAFENWDGRRVEVLTGKGDMGIF